MSRIREWCTKKCCCACRRRGRRGAAAEENGKPTTRSSTNASDTDELTRLSAQSPVSSGEPTDLTLSLSLSPDSSIRDTKNETLETPERNSSIIRHRRVSFSTESRTAVKSTHSEGDRHSRLTNVEQKRISDAIDRELRRQKSQIANRSVVLLLGTGESGKSTFLKQLRILHNRQFTEDELQAYRSTILNNAFFGVITLLTAAEIFNVSLAPENASHGNNLSRIAAELHAAKQSCSPAAFFECADSLEAVWNDRAIQAAYTRRSEFHVGENVRYFLRNLRRIAALDYRPTHEDVLYARKPTKGVIELAIDINRRPFVFVDVGGQRVERAKWCRVFSDSLTCIVFLVASSEFDQTLVEDPSVNRLTEAANVFETIVNNRSFGEISLVMFFNKADILEEKVAIGATKRLADHFPKFSGDCKSLVDVQHFIVGLFQKRIRDQNRPFYRHFTTAVDTNNIQLVFRSVKDILLEKNIESIMLH